MTRTLRRLLLGAILLAGTASCASGTTGHGTTADAPAGGAGTAAASGPASSPAGRSAAPSAALPGLYGLSALGATVTGNTVHISTATDCGPVLDLLRAGQWELDVFLRPHGGQSSMYAATMRRGDRAAMLELDDAPQACSGTITHDTPAALTLTGALSSSGPARLVPFECEVTKEDISDSSNLMRIVFAGVYQTPAGTYVVQFGAPSLVGKHQLDLSGDGDGVVVLPVPAGGSGLTAAAKVLANALDPTRVQQDQNPFPGIDLHHVFGSEEGARGSLQVTSLHPLVATVTVSGLTPFVGGRARAAVSADLRCDT